MAVHRTHVLKIGKKDRLVQAAGLKSGDAFLDCTCGLGADAVVAAYAAGEEGSVRALEASSLLASIVGFGLSRYTHNKLDLMRAMRRVDVLNRDYARVLPELETDSWDVVYFDPMFQRRVSGARSIDLVHLLAHSDLPGPEAVNEALRVARRCVVIKDRYPGRFLSSLDIPVFSAKQRICYGRMDARSPPGSSRKAALVKHKKVTLGKRRPCPHLELLKALPDMAFFNSLSWLAGTERGKREGS